MLLLSSTVLLKRTVALDEIGGSKMNYPPHRQAKSSYLTGNCHTGRCALDYISNKNLRASLSTSLERLWKAKQCCKDRVLLVIKHHQRKAKTRHPPSHLSDPSFGSTSESTLSSFGKRNRIRNDHHDSRASDRRDNRASYPFEAEGAHDTSSRSPSCPWPRPYELSLFLSPGLPLPSPRSPCPASHAFVALPFLHRDRPDAPCL